MAAALPMTPKQTEKLTKKIADIKRILAAEKRNFGAYDDGGFPEFLFESAILLLHIPQKCFHLAYGWDAV